MNIDNAPILTDDPEEWFTVLKRSLDEYLKFVLSLASLAADPKNGKWEWHGMTFSIFSSNAKLLYITGPSNDYTSVEIPSEHSAFRLAQFRAEVLHGVEYIMKITVALDGVISYDLTEEEVIRVLVRLFQANENTLWIKNGSPEMRVARFLESVGRLENTDSDVDANVTQFSLTL